MIWGMGVLIAAAAVVVVAMIVKAVHRPEAAEIAGSLPVPVACAVAQMTTSGDRLILSLSGDGADCRRILIADMVSGKLIGQFELNGN